MKSSAFWRRHTAPASRRPFVKAHVMLSRQSEKKIWDASRPQQGNVTQVRLVQRCQDPLCQYLGCNLTLPSPSASHPLQLMWPLLAVISPLTQDKESVRGDIINICALVPALSKLTLSGSANPRKDSSAGKLPFEQDKGAHVISHSL